MRAVQTTTCTLADAVVGYLAVAVSWLMMWIATGRSEEPRWAAPPLDRSISVRAAGADQETDWSEMVADLAGADVVFVGETHDDETSHRCELALFQALTQQRQRKVVLALEMFERDVQPVLDDYLAGRVDEATFLARSRPWPNYRTSYRPLVEFARQQKLPVVASNFPRPLLRQLDELAKDWPQGFPPSQRQWVPAQLFPHSDAYWRRVDNATRSHAGFLRGGDRLLSTQSLWDNTMADTCAQLLDRYPGHLVLHVNGDFHSTYRQGVVHQLLQRRPAARVKTVSLVPTSHPASARWFGTPPADYVIFVLALAADRENDRYSIVGTRRVKYALHVPQVARPDHPLPLVVVFVAEGLVAQDGLEWWTSRLQDQAAIAVLEPLYQETQPDQQVGGRWYWNDSFSEDVAASVHAVEEIWSYAVRHFPVDPNHVFVVGEGTGATVAVATAVWTQRPSVTAVALRPRQFAKLKEMPLPLPELWGTYTPPRRSLRLLTSDADAAWWQTEIDSYRQVGVTAEWIPLGESDDELRVWENELRRAIGLPLADQPPADQVVFLVPPSTAPRAQHWCRMQAEWLHRLDRLHVVVTRKPPPSHAGRLLSTEISPASFLLDDALPKCPGPFGGTTVLVLPPDTPDARQAEWLRVEEQDPLARQSRFHRVRVATWNGPRPLSQVLEKLESENRKNILIVPAVFYADGPFVTEIRRVTEMWENRMTIHCLAGLGGSKQALRQPSAIRAPVHYDISASVKPDSHEIYVQCRITLPMDVLRQTAIAFELDEQCDITSTNIELEKTMAVNANSVTYTLRSIPADGILQVSYRGRFDYALSEAKDEYTRGFRHTRGWIGSEGVFLDGRSRWLPYFDDRLVTFRLRVEQPQGWHLISQGDGTSQGADGNALWESKAEMEEVYLVGGPLYVERDSVGSIELYVYLRQQDMSLARKYIDIGAQYLEMYRQLIGPYPYTKFAVIENFWETGYGMPSFTLLGSQVIRFPFILHSSYPHEILHNWWGNGVYVDYSRGNWCEGLTAYLADHLVQEQRGAGSEYRRNALQRYRDYVRQGKDFPLAEFENRHDAATEAVGYAKGMMVFHGIRRQIGDDAFRAGLVDFYRRFRGKRAGIDDLCDAWEQASGKSLDHVVTTWWKRAGAPRLELHDVTVSAHDAGSYTVEGWLVQTQTDDVFPLEVPIYLQTTQQTVEHVVAMSDRRMQFHLTAVEKPVALYVDPLFDLFRQLDYRETPPTLSGLFGQEHVLAVMPRKATPEEQQGYLQLLEAWRTEQHQIDVLWDDQFQAWPEGKSVWILGATNRWVPLLMQGSDLMHWDEQRGELQLERERLSVRGRTVVVVRRHPQQEELVVGWLSVGVPAAFPGVARKLPHYGKYSYLVFEGDEPVNTVKGQWPVLDSPLWKDLRGDDRLALTPLSITRPALAELPPAFSGRALAAHVEWLAAPEREGRGVGTAGLTAAAHYLAQAMKQAGLQPAGVDGHYFQPFTVPGPNGQPIECYNVIGVIPGKRKEWQDQSVILCAHYDHLGRGWPDVRAGNEGLIHPGADDNASGVAVILEVARALAAQGGGERPLVLIAFSAEEVNRAGSRYFLEHPTRPLGGVRAVINLDSVGRLERREILILGTGSADEWQHIFRGCSFVTGVPSRNVAHDVGGSDQVSFLEKGIPAVQLFTGPHADYHRPSDTADKVDTAGMVQVATFVKEAVEYLLQREEPLTVRLDSARTPPGQESSTRRVALGIIPAYDYPGPGVKLEGALDNSPAARAGLRAGDVIVSWNREALADLRALSQRLRSVQPGQTVRLTIRRGGQLMEITVQLEER